MMLHFETTSRIVDLRHGVSWDGDAFQDQCHRRLALFDKLSLGPGATVALAHGGTPAIFADLYALWPLGVCVACHNARLTQGELDNVTAFMGAAAVLVDGNSPLQAPGNGAPLICAEADMSATTRPVTRSVNADDPALILFTSGTTGAPKGVVHTFASLAARIDLNRRHMGDATLARTLCVLPTHFGHGLIGNGLTPLAAGGDLLLYPEMTVAEMTRLGGVLDDNEITFISSVPTFWKIITKLARPPARNTLDQVHVGSAPFSAELWKAVQTWTGTDNVLNMYGITETANWLAGASGRDQPPEDGLMGAMWGGDAAVLDEAGAIHSQGEGELLVRTPAIMSGYLHRDDLTGDVLRDGWFCTGDIGRIDATASFA